MKLRPAYFFICYLIIFLGLLILLSVFGVRRIADVSQLDHDQEISLYAGHSVSQQIRPHHNGLNVITIFLKNTALRNTRPFIFSLIENDQVIRQININGSNIGDGDNVRFQFAPLVDSAGKTYTISLSSPDSIYGNSVGVGYLSSKKSITYQTYYLPQNKIGSVVDLFSIIISRFSLGLIISWIGVGLIGFLVAKKGIISL